MHSRILRPDAKGRITLGSQLTEGISSFLVVITDDHKIILEPRVEISAHEKWLFENKAALKQVKQGLNDATEGKTSSLGSFAQYTDDEIE